MIRARSSTHVLSKLTGMRGMPFDGCQEIELVDGISASHVVPEVRIRFNGIIAERRTDQVTIPLPCASLVRAPSGIVTLLNPPGFQDAIAALAFNDPNENDLPDVVRFVVLGIKMRTYGTGRHGDVRVEIHAPVVQLCVDKLPDGRIQLSDSEAQFHWQLQVYHPEDNSWTFWPEFALVRPGSGRSLVKIVRNLIATSDIQKSQCRDRLDQNDIAMLSHDWAALARTLVENSGSPTQQIRTMLASLITPFAAIAHEAETETVTS